MRRIVRIGLSGTAVLCLVGTLVGLGGPAGASTKKKAIIIKVQEVVDAQTTLATLKQTVTIPPGTFSGGINAMTEKLTGTLKLPPATTTVSLAGIGLADATFTIVPTKLVVGSFNFNTYWMKATSVFNIHVDSVTPVGLAVNLAGTQCETSIPVTLSFGGHVSPFGSGLVTGTYAVPPLKNCGLITAVLNAAMSGPGNTFQAVFPPKY